MWDCRFWKRVPLQHLARLNHQGVWESLVYDGPVKRDLLNYAFAMLHLSIRGVDSNIVGCNRFF